MFDNQRVAIINVKTIHGRNGGQITSRSRNHGQSCGEEERNESILHWGPSSSGSPNNNYSVQYSKYDPKKKVK